MKSGKNNTTPQDVNIKAIYVGKTCKVVKGGRKFRFSVLVLAGDGKGRIGLGLGKAIEAADAKEKAANNARKNMIKIPLRDGRTIHHNVIGKFGSGKVLMRSAPSGTGIIAGGSIRTVMELLGIKDIVVKSLGSSNPHNMVKAALEGLLSTVSPKFVAEKRNISIGEIVNQRDSGQFVPVLKTA